MANEPTNRATGLEEPKENQLRQLGRQQSIRSRDPGDQDTAERIVNAACPGANTQNDAQDSEARCRERQKEPKRNPPKDEQGKIAHAERGHGEAPHGSGYLVYLDHGRFGALHSGRLQCRIVARESRANHEPTCRWSFKYCARRARPGQ